jgi:hypothetical protein
LGFSALLASFSTALPQHQHLLTLDGSESVLEAYRYQLACLSPNGNIELQSLLGVAARLGVLDANGSKMVRCGVVSRAELLGSDGSSAKYGCFPLPEAAPFCDVSPAGSTKWWMVSAVPLSHTDRAFTPSGEQHEQPTRIHSRRRSGRWFCPG